MISHVHMILNCKLTGLNVHAKYHWLNINFADIGIIYHVNEMMMPPSMHQFIKFHILS